LVNRETVLKNKNSSSEVRHFFLVHSENFSNHPRIYYFKIYYIPKEESKQYVNYLFKKRLL
jgi:hypothetical protein